jgi:hypothetical protein
VGLNLVIICLLHVASIARVSQKMRKDKKECIMIRCPNCNTEFVDPEREKMRDRLAEAGRKRQEMVTAEDRVKFSASSKRTRAFNEEQRTRHEILGRPYEKGLTLITDEEWAHEIGSNTALVNFQHPEG